MKRQPTTLLDVVTYFADERRAFDHFVSKRFPNGVACSRLTPGARPTKSSQATCFPKRPNGGPSVRQRLSTTLVEVSFVLGQLVPRLALSPVRFQVAHTGIESLRQLVKRPIPLSLVANVRRVCHVRASSILLPRPTSSRRHSKSAKSIDVFQRRKVPRMGIRFKTGPSGVLGLRLGPGHVERETGL